MRTHPSIHPLSAASRTLVHVSHRAKTDISENKTRTQSIINLETRNACLPAFLPSCLPSCLLAFLPSSYQSSHSRHHFISPCLCIKRKRKLKKHDCLVSRHNPRIPLSSRLHRLNVSIRTDQLHAPTPTLLATDPNLSFLSPSPVLLTSRAQAPASPASLTLTSNRPTSLPIE